MVESRWAITKVRPCYQVAEAILESWLPFGESEVASSRIRNRRSADDMAARNREPLALAPGELDRRARQRWCCNPRKAFGELIDAGNGNRRRETAPRSQRAGEDDVFADGAVEEKGFLQHHASWLRKLLSRTVERIYHRPPAPGPFGGWKARPS